jgi:hypothetical protein
MAIVRSMVRNAVAGGTFSLEDLLDVKGNA